MRRIAAVTLAAALAVGGGPSAYAENAMGYRMLPEQEARQLPQNQGALGLQVDRAQQITDSGMTFDIMRVTGVRAGSAGAQAGFRTGDQLIAVNGRVFPTLRAFAAYVGSMSPGSTATIDYMPIGAGPGNAQRVAVTVGAAGQSSQPRYGQPMPDQPAPDRSGSSQTGGLSTGTKVAIGAGAVALLGCYELGCFSHRKTPPARTPAPAPPPSSGQRQYQ